MTSTIRRTIWLLFCITAFHNVANCEQFEEEDIVYHSRRLLQHSPETYLRDLYRHFSSLFWKTHGTSIRQFAVVTIGQLHSMPHLSASDFPLDHPHDVNAAYYYDTNPRHTEPVLLDTLASMILSYLHDTGRLPDSVYLYTYNVPCLRCTAEIKHFIEYTFPNVLKLDVAFHPQYSAALRQLPYMTYRIGWTLELNPNEAGATVHEFADIADVHSTSHVVAYRRIKL